MTFKTFVPSGRGALAEQADELKAQLLAWLAEEHATPEALLHTRIYLSDALNQWDEVSRHGLCASLLEKGAVSYVEQPLLCGAKIALLVTASFGQPWQKSGTPDALCCERDGLKLLFQTVRLSAEEAQGRDAREQTRLAFERHASWLSRLGGTLARNCLRTWLYVRDIDRHYADVVTGRNEVFEACGLTRDTHYIASTGIGGETGNAEALVGIDFFSVIGLEENAVRYLQAPEYLNPTYEYGVAFERATAAGLPFGRMVFVSGTASIDKHGNCLHEGDVLTQAGRAFLNVEKLLEAGGGSLADLQYLLVYLRDVADAESVRTYISLRFPRLPALVLEARVCRPEWLIEVEGVAHMPKNVL